MGGRFFFFSLESQKKILEKNFGYFIKWVVIYIHNILMV